MSYNKKEMSYNKGVWKVGRESACVVSSTPVPEIVGSDEVAYYGGHLIGESMSEANSNRIVDCVNACDGMESPADEIVKLRRERDELLRVMIEIKSEYEFASSYGDQTCIPVYDIDIALELCGVK